MDSRKSWVTCVWEAWNNINLAPRLAGILAFGGTSAVVLIFYIICHRHLITGSVLIIAICIHVLDFIISYGIFDFETKIMPSFFDAVKKVIPNEKKSDQIHMTRMSSFSLKHWWFSLPTCILAIIVFFTNKSMITILAIKASFTNPFYWIGLFHITLIFHLAGIGLSMVIKSFFVVRYTIYLFREIHPLHPDKCGGLKFFGTFILKITSWLACGSFVLPPLFVLNPGNTLFITVFAGMYSIVILSSFIIPVKIISKRARLLQYKTLYDLWQKITYYKQKSEECLDHERLYLFLQIQELRARYNEFRKLNVYPLNIQVISKVTTLVLLPIVFSILNLFVTKAM